MSVSNVGMTRWWRDHSVSVLIGVLVIQIIVIGLLGRTGSRLIDEVNSQRDSDIIGQCIRGNASRSDINDLNIAINAVANALDATTNAIDGSATALIAAAAGSDGLSEEGQVAADQFLAATTQHTNEARLLLQFARGLLNDALLSIRDCDRVLESPDATIPATTIPLTSPLTVP